MSIGVVAPYKKSYDISEVIMKREELIAMGVSEEDADKIMADYGSSIQREKAKTAQYKEQAEKADELQKRLDDFEAGNLTELDKANKALEKANQQIAELQKNNAIRDLREKAMTDFRITAEQAKEVVGDDGNFDTAALGKIMSEKETAAAQAKEKEIANGSTNPGGGSAGGDKNKEKTADVENAENITFGVETNVEDQNHYVI